MASRIHNFTVLVLSRRNPRGTRGTYILIYYVVYTCCSRYTDEYPIQAGKRDYVRIYYIYLPT